MRRNKTFVVIIVLLIIIVGAYLYIDQISNRGERLILEVDFRLDAPYSTAELFLTENLIIYSASGTNADSTNERIIEKIDITPDQFKKISNLIIKNNFWNFKNEYIDEKIESKKSYTVMVKSIWSGRSKELQDASVKSVYCSGDCPTEVFEIIREIKNLWGRDILEIGI